MMLGIEKEAAIFLYAGLSGIVVFSGYQMMALFRKMIRHSMWAVNTEDFLYWVLVSAYLFRQMYHTTYGLVRWFFILGVVLGSFIAFSGKRFLKKRIGNCKKALEKHNENR